MQLVHNLCISNLTIPYPKRRVWEMKSFFHPTWFRIALILLIFVISALIFDFYDTKQDLEYRKLLIQNNLQLPKSDIAERLTFTFKYNNSAVRACPSFDCEIIGLYHQGDPFYADIKIRSWLELPEWIGFTSKDDASTTMFIHKSNLSEVPIP